MKYEHALSPRRIQADVHRVTQNINSQTRKVIPKNPIDGRSLQESKEQRTKELSKVTIRNEGTTNEMLIYEQSITDSEVSQTTRNNVQEMNIEDIQTNTNVNETETNNAQSLLNPNATPFEHISYSPLGSLITKRYKNTHDENNETTELNDMKLTLIQMNENYEELKQQVLGFAKNFAENIEYEQKRTIFMMNKLKENERRNELPVLNHVPVSTDHERRNELHIINHVPVNAEINCDQNNQYEREPIEKQRNFREEILYVRNSEKT